MNTEITRPTWPLLLSITLGALVALCVHAVAFQDNARPFGGITTGEALERDKEYASPNNTYYFTFSLDGNLTVRRRSDDFPVWRLVDQVPAAELFSAASAVLREDGVFVVADGAGKPIWSISKEENAKGKVGSLGVNDDGRLGLWNYDPLVPYPHWLSTLTLNFPINPGQHFKRGDRAYSVSGNHFLNFNTDGNLVVAENPNGGFVWGLNLIPDLPFTEGQTVALTEEGKLTFLDSSGTLLWEAPKTGAAPGSKLDLTKDGVLQLVAPDGAITWASDGNLTQNADSVAATPAPTHFPLAPGDALTRSDKVLSSSGDHVLVFNPDGNVVVARHPGLEFVWGLNLLQGVPFREAQSLRMTKEGRLSVFDAQGKVLWSVPEGNPVPNSILHLTPEGVLELWQPDGSTAWSSQGGGGSAKPAIASTAEPAPAATPPAELPPAELPDDALPFSLDRFHKELHGIDAQADGLGTFSTQPQIEARYQNGQLFVAWQNHTDGLGVQISAYSRQGNTFHKQWRKTLPGTLDRFAGLTADGENYYILTAANEDKSKEPGWARRPGILKLVKVNPQGEALWTKDLNAAEGYTGRPHDADTKFGGVGHAVYSPMTAGSADLAYGAGKVAVTYSTNSPYDAPIKTRHQTAVRLSVNSTDGSPAAQGQPYSWKHSFDQRVIFDGSDFVLADQPDAGWYLPGPGIELVKIKNADDSHSGGAMGWYVYTRNGDNNFSSIHLGDLAAGQKGYVVSFVANRNSRSATDDAPRNLALLHVVQDFAAQPLNAKKSQSGGFDSITVGQNLVDTRSGNPAATSDETIRSTNSYRQGTVQNTGVVWLTNYQKSDQVTVSRPKLQRLANERFLLAAEEWEFREHDYWKNSAGNPKVVSQKPLRTVGMVVGEYGQVIKPLEALNDVPLRFRDKLFALEPGQAGWIHFDQDAATFVLTVIDDQLNQRQTPLGL